MRIVIGEGSCGIAAGAEKVRQELLKHDLDTASLDIAGDKLENIRKTVIFNRIRPLMIFALCNFSH